MLCTVNVLFIHVDCCSQLERGRFEFYGLCLKGLSFCVTLCRLSGGSFSFLGRMLSTVYRFAGEAARPRSVSV